jgi:ribosomal protein S18 acetylase RimI-like enzyme
MTKHLKIPPGYEIREARMSDAQDIAYVHVTTWKTSYKGIVEQTYLDAISYDDRLALRKKILNENSGVHFVATFHSRVIAFYDAGSFRFHKNQKVTEKQLKHRNEAGEIYAIYILQEHQHQGVGRALFQLSKSKLKECGLTPYIAWVLKDNHQAIKFYENMGGELVDEVSVMIGNSQYIEIAYRFTS